MIERRKLLGLLGAQAMCCMPSAAVVVKPKDPCRGKLLPESASVSLSTTRGTLGIESRQPYFGDTIAAVHRDFQATIERNFLEMPRAEINRYMGRLHERELELLFQIYDSATLNTARPARLLDIVSPTLDGDQARRLIRLQGFERMYASILRVAPTRAQIAIDAMHIGKSLGTAPVTGAGFNENPLDYTVKEIYLSYRTAPKGSFSVPAAMYETANFVGLRLTGAFGIGYSVGTVIQKAWETLSPDTWGKFSNFIGSSIDSFVDSAASMMGMTPYSAISEPTHIRIGALQENLWNDFEDTGPRSWYAGGGDYGVTASWQIKDLPRDCK